MIFFSGVTRLRLLFGTTNLRYLLYLQHSQKTLHTRRIAAVFIDEDTAEIEEARVFVRLIKVHHLQTRD